MRIERTGVPHRAAEGEGLSEMGGHDARPLGLRDILSLSTKVAERVLHTRSAGHTLSVNELEAVVKAAEFLQEHKIPWPAVITEVIDILVAQMEAVRAETGSCIDPDGGVSRAWKN